MLHIQCTRNLFRYLGLAPQPLPEEPNDTPLGTWYANIIGFDDLDFLLFVNDPTLFAIVLLLPDPVSASDIATLFMGKLFITLVGEGVVEPLARSLLDAYEPVRLTKTSSRSMLGSMNDLTQNLLAYIDYDLTRFGLIDLPALQKRLNRIPQRKLNWEYAVDVMHQHLLRRP